ncbi:hypothetical protein SAY87_032023 [Trapa incisa]|uniref:Uncharacterized protein n=1 Tax=Trapa incisa TaxID=236973 RepID=A0AAN7KQJ9_9MYRT|nr:hypothetical protein SAY87_032023 [Trapa incisa]
MNAEAVGSYGAWMALLGASGEFKKGKLNAWMAPSATYVAHFDLRTVLSRSVRRFRRRWATWEAPRPHYHGMARLMFVGALSKPWLIHIRHKKIRLMRWVQVANVEDLPYMKPFFSLGDRNEAEQMLCLHCNGYAYPTLSYPILPYPRLHPSSPSPSVCSVKIE